MYHYPSIEGPNKAPHEQCIAFYKIDGSNLRWEWTRKRGWHKFGSRNRLFDESDPVLGQAIDIFMRKYAEPLQKIILDSKDYRNAQNVIAFTEFFGANSFAGQHKPEDPKDLILFDVRVHKKGLLGPREFLNSFGHLETAKVVYEGVLNQSFIESVRASHPTDGNLGLNEGVVCKGGSGHDLWLRKIKTNFYFERLKKEFSENWKDFWE